jgi:hypothetical protein
MPSLNLDRLTAEFPTERTAVERLVNFIAEVLGRNREATLSMNRVMDIARPSSTLMLSRILERLVEEGVLQQIVRVESEGLGGIGDYPSVSDVPDVIHDFRRDVDVRVKPEHLHLYYDAAHREDVAHAPACFVVDAIVQRRDLLKIAPSTRTRIATLR